MRSLMTCLKSRRRGTRLASVLFLVQISGAFDATSPLAGNVASDQSPLPVAVGDVVVLTGPDASLAEREVLRRKKEVRVKPIPGRDRLFYQVRLVPGDGSSIRLSSLDDDRQGYVPRRWSFGQTGPIDTSRNASPTSRETPTRTGCGRGFGSNKNIDRKPGRISIEQSTLSPGGPGFM